MLGVTAFVSVTSDSNPEGINQYSAGGRAPSSTPTNKANAASRAAVFASHQAKESGSRLDHRAAGEAHTRAAQAHHAAQVYHLMKTSSGSMAERDAHTDAAQQHADSRVAHLRAASRHQAATL